MCRISLASWACLPQCLCLRSPRRRQAERLFSLTLPFSLSACDAHQRNKNLMPRILSNGPAKDFVLNGFKRLLHGASSALLAAPYFTLPDEIVTAAGRGTRIYLLIGLN